MHQFVEMRLPQLDGQHADKCLVLRVDAARNVCEMVTALRDDAEQTPGQTLVRVQVRADSNGFDLFFYHEGTDTMRPSEPLARVLIEYHRSEVRAFLYPTGSNVNGDPFQVCRLIGPAALAEKKERARTYDC